MPEPPPFFEVFHLKNEVGWRLSVRIFDHIRIEVRPTYHATVTLIECSPVAPLGNGGTSVSVCTWPSPSVARTVM